MKKIIFSILLFTPFITTAQYSQLDSLFIQNIGQHILNNSLAHQDLKSLCKDIGHRISGSIQADKAVIWAKQKLIEAGADTVWLQPVMVPVWERGAETLKIKFNNSFEEVPMLSLGNTEGTNGKKLEAEIVLFNSLEALINANDKDVKGKIVFLNIKFPRDVYNTFDGYGIIARNRSAGVNEASKKGAIAFMLRSISTSKFDIPHTGASHYADGLPKIPAIAIGTTTAERLAQHLMHQKAYAQIVSNCKMNGMKRSYNVIGELKGKINSDKYILVGGHLDSWDVGEGAHDDGVGCIQSIHTLKAFKDLNYKPNNTLRVVLFMNEENGMKGGLAYADSVIANKEYHIFALESDAGGFTPRGIGLTVPEKERVQAQSWMPILKQFGLYDFTQDGCGVDITPLKKQNIKVGELMPDSQRYFDFHHNNHDIFEAVNERELLLGTAGIASFIYLVDNYWQ